MARIVVRNRPTVATAVPMSNHRFPVPLSSRRRTAKVVTAASSLTTEAFIRNAPKRLSARLNSRSMMPSTGSAVIEMVSATKSEVSTASVGYNRRTTTVPNANGTTKMAIPNAAAEAPVARI